MSGRGGDGARGTEDDDDGLAQAANLPVVSKELFDQMSQRAGAVTKAREDKEKAKEDKFARRGSWRPISLGLACPLCQQGVVRDARRMLGFVRASFITTARRRG